MRGREKLNAALEECRVHAEVLRDARFELGDTRFSATTVTGISAATRRLLDQLAYRFTKLQDSIGTKVFPGLLDLAEEPLPENATFAEKLQRLERLGAVESVAQWRTLRELRNQLSYEYLDAPELKAAALNRFVKGVDELLATWEQADNYAIQNQNSGSGPDPTP